MKRICTSAMVVALVVGSWLTVGPSASAKSKAKAKAKAGPPTFVVNLHSIMHETSADLDRSAEIQIVNGVFVGTVGNAQYHFGNPTAGTYVASSKETGGCWSIEASGSGQLTAMLALELNLNTAIRFYTHKGARLGVIQGGLDVAVPVTNVKPLCDIKVENGPRKVGDLLPPNSIPVPILRCVGLPTVNQGGETASPGGVLSKSSPWSFTIDCTTPGSPNTSGSVTTGTVTGTVSYTGPTPELRSWLIAG